MSAGAPARRPIDPSRLAINGATVRKKWGLDEIIAGCVRHGYAAVLHADALRVVGVPCDIEADFCCLRIAEWPHLDMDESGVCPERGRL